MAKYLAAQNMKDKTPYWTDGENFVTVDPYGVTNILSVALRD